jgi:hypothetical protein
VILAYAIILLVLIALLLRRDLSAIGRMSYRGGGKFLVFVIGLFVLQAKLVLYVPGQALLQTVLVISSQLALIGLVLFNHRVPGAKIFALGVAFNVIVMVANGGWMPVTPETYHFVHPDRIVPLYTRPVASKNIILPRPKTRLWFLSDIIRVALPWRRNAVSMGDLLLILGVAFFIFQVTAKNTGRISSRQTSERVS